MTVIPAAKGKPTIQRDTDKTTIKGMATPLLLFVAFSSPRRAHPDPM